MKALLVERGLYKRGESFYERPWINGKRTWRVLKAITLKAARAELASKRTDQNRSEHGLAKNPYAPKTSVTDLCKIFFEDGCLGRKRIPPKNNKAHKAVGTALTHLCNFFKGVEALSLNQSVLLRYELHRKAEIQSKLQLKQEEPVDPHHGERIIEMELVALSNVMHHAVRKGLIPHNPISKREGIRRAENVKHSRDKAPLSVEAVHQVATKLFASRKTAHTQAWQLLFLSLTGCRRSESLMLRWDAKSMDEPGFIEGDYLFIRRSKGGVNPYIVLTPVLHEYFRALKAWREELAPDNPYFFPSRRMPGKPANVSALGSALDRVTTSLNLKRFTPHGIRSFYVTARRSQGISDGQIAAEIGDATGPSIIAQIYGSIPPNWQGSKNALAFTPAEGSTAWDQWLPVQDKIVPMRG